ncbi:hypothetical protein ATN79_27870 [Paraburkholderia caribensis]|nr:hypothetical protein ATN79_27870 [Paraburkholderia caribensis]
MTHGVYSEVGTLRKVIVCRPGLAQARLTPANCHDLLFDDVLWVSQAKTDHYASVSTMEEHGVEVLEMHDLLADVLQGREAREWILERKLTPGVVDAELGAQLVPWLDEMKPEELAAEVFSKISAMFLPVSLRTDSASSQLGRKESLKDTARVLGRLYDGIEYRGFHQTTVEELAAYSHVPVWNGLTDEFHPTQVLADLLSMQEFGDKPLHELSFCYLGDARFDMGNSLDCSTNATLLPSPVINARAATWAGALSP